MRRLLPLLLIPLFVPCVSSGNDYETTFTGARETIPGDWSLHADGSIDVARDGSGAVTFSLKGEGAPPGAATLSLQKETIADGRISTLLHYRGLYPRRGIVARMQSGGEPDPKGYYAYVYRAGDIDFLEIARDPQGSGGKSLGRAKLPPLEPDDYTLIFELEGSRLTAVLYDASESTEMGRLSVKDETYSEGTIGLRCYINAFYPNKQSLPRFRTFRISQGTSPAN